MKTIAFLALLLVSSPAAAQTCSLQSCPAGLNSAWCRTTNDADFRDAQGRYCDMCSPNAGACLLANGDDCVNDCRVCKDSSGNPWTQDGITDCFTDVGNTRTTYANLCQYCAPGHQRQIAACDPFYCGAIDAIHCRVRDCWTCP